MRLRTGAHSRSGVLFAMCLLALVTSLLIIVRLDVRTGYVPFMIGTLVCGLGIALTGPPASSASESSMKQRRGYAASRSEQPADCKTLKVPGDIGE